MIIFTHVRVVPVCTAATRTTFREILITHLLLVAEAEMRLQGNSALKLDIVRSGMALG